MDEKHGITFGLDEGAHAICDLTLFIVDLFTA